MTRIPALGAIALGVGVVVVAAAGPAGAFSKGVASGSAPRIIRAGVAAVKSASSVTVVGHLDILGESISVHVSDAKNGDGSGTVDAEGVTVQVKKVGSTIYVLAGSAALSTLGGPAAAQYAGKWIEAPASTSHVSTFSQFLTIKTLLGKSSVRTTDLVLRKSGTTVVGGRRAIVVTGRSPTSGGKGRARFVVATTGMPYLLSAKVSVEASGLTASADLTFSGFGHRVAVSAPSGAVSLSSVLSPSSSS